MTASTPTERATSSANPLRPRPDQSPEWLAHGRPIALTEAANIVIDAHRRDGARKDLAAVDLRSWIFGSADYATMHVTRIPLPGREPGPPLALRELAFGQLCQRLSAPASYVRDLPMKLQVACMNWGMALAQPKALLRLSGEEVRAIVSERYAPIDDEVLLDVVDDVLGKSGYRHDALVRATVVGPHTVLRITVPNESVAVRAGDTIEWGLDLGNSELGLRSVQITPVTYRLACTNGMRAWRSEAALRLRHIGDPDRLREQLRDTIPVAFAEARGDLARWRKATELLIDNALEEVNSLRGLGLAQGDVQAVARSLAVTMGMVSDNPTVEAVSTALRASTSVFDVANAITSTARERSDVATRLALEETAHRYLVREAA